jgi:hypothetical protein
MKFELELTCQNDGIDYIGTCINPCELEDQGKRSGGSIAAVIGEIGIRTGHTHSNQKDSDDIEYNDTPKDGSDGTRDSLGRVFRFTRSDPN